MPRQARKKSESGIYHVMLRGINRQQIFEEQEDYEKFLRLLKEYKAISGYKLFAYCLMSNHIHLLIKIEDEPIEQVFKRIGSRFVYWYNIKYQRSGHLFQDRFKSEPVENNEYFLTVLRYIHQNPVKAKLCKKPEDYLYSSYTGFKTNGTLIDKIYVYEIIDILYIPVLDSKSDTLFFKKQNFVWFHKKPFFILFFLRIEGIKEFCYHKNEPDAASCKAT